MGLFPFQMAFSWLINGGDPNHLLSGMILQVRPHQGTKVVDWRPPFRSKKHFRTQLWLHSSISSTCRQICQRFVPPTSKVFFSKLKSFLIVVGCWLFGCCYCFFWLLLLLLFFLFSLLWGVTPKILASQLGFNNIFGCKTPSAILSLRIGHP